MKQFEAELKQMKKDQEEYFRLITSGHCAICLAELVLPKEALDVLDTATCSDCAEKGWDKIFQMGIVCGRELKKWKDKPKKEKD